MLCLQSGGVKIAEGSPSGDLQDTESQLIPGETERETEGCLTRSVLSPPQPQPPAQSEKIEIFTINSLTEIFFCTLEKFLNIYLNSGVWTQIFSLRPGSGRALLTTDLVDVFTVSAHLT